MGSGMGSGHGTGGGAVDKKRSCMASQPPRQFPRLGRPSPLPVPYHVNANANANLQTVPACQPTAHGVRAMAPLNLREAIAAVEAETLAERQAAREVVLDKPFATSLPWKNGQQCLYFFVSEEEGKGTSCL